MTIAFLAFLAIALATMCVVDAPIKPTVKNEDDAGGDKLIERMVALRAKCDEILESTKKDDRRLTEEERDQLKEANHEFNDLKEEKQLREGLEGQAVFLDSSPGPVVPPDQPRLTTEFPDARGGEPVQSVQPSPTHAAQPRAMSAGRCGFRSFGDFAQRVLIASAKGGDVDKRLLEMRAPTTVGTEGSGADGGFSVPPDFKNEIIKQVTGEDTLLGLTNQIQINTNNLTVPKDETTPWGTNGLQAYWEGEASQETQSKPSLEQVSLRANKVTALVPISDELLEDSTALDSWLRAKAPDMINFKINLAILQGSGAGQPLGILNAPGTVAVAKESGQTADTVVFENILKMWNAMYSPFRDNNAVWLLNQDVEPQLQQMVLAGSSSDVPVWLPAGGISGKPFNTLYGHRIITTQACETLGDLGDIVFAAMPQYMTVVKAGGIRAETSMHLWFDYGVMAFRFVMRVGGLPMWSSTISARDGSGSYGAFVTLAVRA